MFYPARFCTFLRRNLDVGLGKEEFFLFSQSQIVALSDLTPEPIYVGTSPLCVDALCLPT